MRRIHRGFMTTSSRKIPSDQAVLKSNATSTSDRISSIDHYRGYAIFGMILVNYLGGFDSMPWQLKHHDYGMSYADTIAPLFMFVVGMGMRPSLQRRIARDGYVQAYSAALRRNLALVVVGIILYGPRLENWRYWWDALVDIGFAAVLALPVLTRSSVVRVTAAFGYLAVFQVVFLSTGYGEWTMSNSIDGGPLGPLSWVSLLLFGTVMQDLIASGEKRRIFIGCLAWGLALSAAGWMLRAGWPGVKSEWPFTQAGMTAPYPLYSAGLCFLAYLPFYWLCDVKNLNIPHLRTLGMNALVIYIVQLVLGDLHGSFVVAPTSQPTMALAGFAAFYLACYAVAWRLRKDGVFIRL